MKSANPGALWPFWDVTECSGDFVGPLLLPEGLWECGDPADEDDTGAQAECELDGEVVDVVEAFVEEARL